jgi:RNA polymerase sigma-70 factor (ECF subfamily)
MPQQSPPSAKSLPYQNRYLRDRRQARLLAQARSGQTEAFQRLYRELYPALARYLSRRLAEPADVEDLLAQVFHRFLTHLAEFDPRRGSVLAWLLTMARHAVVDFYRRQKTELSIDALAEVLAGNHCDPLAAIIREQELQLVWTLLREYPAQTREMFALRFGHNLRYGEIAAYLGLSEDAVKQRFSRTLRELRIRVRERTARGGEVGYAI